jgi:hypothetical protein
MDSATEPAGSPISNEQLEAERLFAQEMSRQLKMSSPAKSESPDLDSMTDEEIVELFRGRPLRELDPESLTIDFETQSPPGGASPTAKPSNT